MKKIWTSEVNAFQSHLIGLLIVRLSSRLKQENDDLTHSLLLEGIKSHRICPIVKEDICYFYIYGRLSATTNHTKLTISHCCRGIYLITTNCVVHFFNNAFLLNDKYIIFYPKACSFLHIHKVFQWSFFLIQQNLNGLNKARKVSSA